MAPHMKRRFAGCAPLLLLLVASSGLGQQVRGRVVDPATGPIAGAAVRLLAAGGRDSVRVETDSVGWFAAALPVPGAWAVTAARVGYGEEGPNTISVAVGQEVELLIRLGARALQLAPLEVRGVRQALTGRDQVYQRIARMKELGIGRSLTRTQIEQLNPQSVGGLLSTMTSQIRSVESPQFVVNTVFLRGGPRGSCAPAIFIDGFRVNQRPTNVNMLIEPRQVEAVELYASGAQAPVGFHDPAGCGSVLIWARRGSPTDGPPHNWRRYLVAGGLVVGALLLFK